mmetsp:Transcript_2770/g.17255  ORF Transcript_2770/g.17255 Transcript_2770/m.17255 type:complete len:106 (+) Transcript_2770:73-390(+)
MAQRVTLRRRHSYATRSNKIRKVKTPGGWMAKGTTRKEKKKNGMEGNACEKNARNGTFRRQGWNDERRGRRGRSQTWRWRACGEIGPKDRMGRWKNERKGRGAEG